MMWEDPQEVFKDYNIQFIKLSAIILRSLGPLEDLALITGYNCAFIRNMENGQRRIHLDTGALLAQSLDVPFYVFFTDSNAESRYWKEEYIRIETKYQKLKKKYNELR
jgi:hypothetical protein